MKTRDASKRPVGLGAGKSGTLPAVVVGVAIVVATFIAYASATGGSFIWDDDSYITDNDLLTEPSGLWRIWKSALTYETPQYYPLVFSTFWIEQKLWGSEPAGYHWVNVALHAISALLVVQVVRAIGLPGAWLAGAIFALHPVHVESVAWVTERKNVLSGTLYLLSLIAFLRHEDAAERRWYAASLVLFVAALSAKTVTCSLPVALLVIRWYRRRPIDLAYPARLAPFFAIGLAMGLFTAHYEAKKVDAVGPLWDFTIPDRFLIAGRALWFYAMKLVWPAKLTFIYPRWEIDARDVVQWLWPISATALAVVLFALRQRVGRGPIAALAFMFATVFPALGFVNVYPMRYSFVADHFQYLASLGPIVLFSALSARGVRRLGTGPAVPSGVRAAGSLVVLVPVAVLAFRTFQEGRKYENARVLWEDTLKKNPKACIAYVQLGVMSADEGNLDEAREYWEGCLNVDPGFPEANANIGNLLAMQGRFEEAKDRYEAALERQPRAWLTLMHLAKVHLSLKDPAAARQRALEAIRALESIEGARSYADLQATLGRAYLAQGRFVEAQQQFEESIKIDSAFSRGYYYLGRALMRQQKYQKAVRPLTTALNLRVGKSPQIRRALAECLFRVGKEDLAMQLDPQTVARIKASPNGRPGTSASGG